MPHLLFYFSLVNGVGQKLYFAGMGRLFFLGAGARIPAGDDDDHDCIDTTDNDDDDEEENDDDKGGKMLIIHGGQVVPSARRQRSSSLKQTTERIGLSTVQHLSKLTKWKRGSVETQFSNL